LTREEFETWIEDTSHRDEAIDRLPTSNRSFENWLKLYALALNTIAKEEAKEADEAEDEAIAEDLDEELGKDDDDDDAGDKEESESEDD
jgi:truncated hemoglobin YjbI